MTVKATALQLAPLFPAKKPSEVYALLGVCPMVGKNDDGTTFTFEDAKVLTAFARANGMGLITFWSFQRDRFQSVGNPDLGPYSGVAQSDYQYLSIFQAP